MRETYQIPIIIDQRALDDSGMGSDRPVTISLRGISLRSVLKLMLSELDLTYVVHDPVLKITTPEGAAKRVGGTSVSGRGLAVADRSSLVVGEQESNYWDDSACNFQPCCAGFLGRCGWGGQCLVIRSGGVSWSVSQMRENHEALDSLLAAVRKVRCSAAGAKGTPAEWQPVPVTSDAKRAAHAKIEQALSTIGTWSSLDTPLSEVARYSAVTLTEYRYLD